MKRYVPSFVMSASVLLVVNTLGVSTSWAQGSPTAALGASFVTWDSLGAGVDQPGGLTRLYSVVAQPGPAGDTLWAASSDVYRLAPGGSLFGPRVNETVNPGPDNVYFVTREGAHLASGGGATYINYSTDGGRTWRRAQFDFDGDGVPEGDGTNGTPGAVVFNFHEGVRSAHAGKILGAGAGGFLWRSVDGGRVWSLLYDFGDAGFRDCYAVVDLVAEPWAGRLVVGFLGRVRYSDDGGQTWADAEGLINRRWDQLIEAPDGTLYAASDNYPGVFVSHDGAATWERLVEFGPGAVLEDPRWGDLAVAPDGTLWLGLSAVNGDPPWQGTFMYSADGGRTWVEAAEGFGRAAVTDVTLDSEGRLVAATWKGVWRTREPVTVGVEDSPTDGKPEGSREGELGAPYPNPARGGVTVPLVLRDAAAVRVGVYDVLGREVAVLRDGPLAAGKHTLALDAEALAPGAYVVHARIGDGTTSARPIMVSE